MKFARNALYGLQSSFRQVQGNARIIVVMQPFWAVANAMYNPYLSLYMKEVGCTDFQVGVINAISMVAGVVIGLFAGWITDRLGRRLTNLIADSLCWAVPCVLWGLSHSFLWFAIAAVSNAFVRLISVSWNCTLTEDTPPERRLTMFWWLNIINNAAIFATPLMTLLIKPLGLESAMRWVLLPTAALYMTLFLIRFFISKESTVGRERIITSRGTSPFTAVKDYVPLIKMVFTNPVLLTFLMIRSLYFVQMGLKGVFLPITLVGIQFDNSIIGTINWVSAIVMLLMQFVLLPRLKRLDTKTPLMVSLGALLVSNVIIMLTPAHNMFVLMLGTIVSAGGAIITGMLVDTATANAMPDQQRAPLLALISLIIVALSAPFQVLGGALAEVPGLGPRLPMLIIVVLFAACMVLLAANNRREKRAALREQAAE